MKTTLPRSHLLSWRPLAALLALSIAAICHAEVAQNGFVTNPTSDHVMVATIRTTVFDRVNGATSTFTERDIVLKPGEKMDLHKETGPRQDGSEGVLWYEATVKVEVREMNAGTNNG